MEAAGRAGSRPRVRSRLALRTQTGSPNGALGPAVAWDWLPACRHQERRVRRSSCALAATTIVERLMRTAPTAGARLIPAHARTPAASGIANALYPVAQARF
jgi:hypothetical protein